MGESGDKINTNDIIGWMIVVVIIAAFIFMIVQKFADDHRPRSYGNNGCINNLRQIDAAAAQFASVHGLTNGAPINFPNDLTPYIKLNSAGKIPACALGGTYHISKVGEAPICSLGTGVTPAHVLP